MWIVNREYFLQTAWHRVVCSNNTMLVRIILLVLSCSSMKY